MATATASRPMEAQTSFHYASSSTASGKRPRLSSNSTSYADPSRPQTAKPTRTLYRPGTESPDSSASLASSSGSSRQHPVVVPQYPYNVAMSQFQGLQVSDRTLVADDNDVQTRLPSICVDYLSHNWDESDVWASWKAMTRHKNELANGVRLENASWRTWAKQRNNLKTISPETLNWLKDSDVTWLYGPLHTAVDPVPPPKQATLSDRLTLDDVASTRSSVLVKVVGESALPTPASAPSSRPTSAMGHRPCKQPGKPILKHRSLSEILGVNGPVSPTASEPTSATATDDDANGSCDDVRKRVAIDPATSNSTFTDKKDSLDAPNARPRTTSLENSAEVTSGEESDAKVSSQPRHASGSEENGVGRKKKHISFSHRVEQCIAVDSSEEERGFNVGAIADDDDEEDEENDMLMFRTMSAMRQHARHQFIKRSEMTLQASIMTDDNVSGSALMDHVTIARMAPTTLKSAESYPPPSPAVIYEDASPPWKFKVASSATDVSKSNQETERNESFVPSYFVRTFGSGGSIDAASISNSRNSQPKYRCDVDVDEDINFKSRWEDDSEDFSSMGFDYFSGPDLGVGDEYDMPSLPSQHLASGAGYVPRGNPRSSAEISPASSGASTPAAHKGRDPLDTPSTPKSILKHTPGVGEAPFVKAASSSSPIDVPGVSSSASSSSLFPQNFLTQPISSVASTPQPEYMVGTSLPLADRPDRRSRGRSSSRGSSASSFERSSGSDRRVASSPSQSPPGSLGVGSAVNRSSGVNPSTRSNRQGSSLTRSGSSNSLVSDGKWIREVNEEDSAVDTRSGSGKGPLAMNGSDSADLRAERVPSKSHVIDGPNGMERKTEGNVLKTNTERSRLDEQGPSGTAHLAGEMNKDADDAQCATINPVPPKLHRGLSGSSRLLSAPRPASTQLADDSDNEHLFDSPHLPSSPTSLEPSNGIPKRSGSFSSIATLRWSDETPVSIAHRSLLRQYSARHSTTTFRDASQQVTSSVGSSTNSGGDGSGGDARTYSDDETASRRLSGDDYGFGYGCSDDEDVGGVVGRAAEIMGTAKDLVGALWTVGSRSLWGKNGLATSGTTTTTATN